ncbi:MAG: hypothetical protein J6X44_14350, partial [Thermoguttaceae bacterium]|nr:hypothetical protein [Thermoguttaceae bacterium]
MRYFRNVFESFDHVAFLVVLTFLELFSFVNGAQAQAPSKVAQNLSDQLEIQKDGEYTFETLFNDNFQNTPQAPVISQILVKGRYIYACADNKSVYRLELEKNALDNDNQKDVREVFNEADSWIRAIATTPELDEIATISQKGQLNVFRVVDEANRQTFVKKSEIMVKTNGAHGLVYSPDGKYIAVCGSDPYISIYKIGRDVGGERIDVSLWKTLSVTNSVSTTIQFSPDGTMLAVGDRNGVVRIWRFNDGKLTEPFLKLTLNDEKSNVGRRVRAVAFNANSALIAIGGDSSRILVYDV